MVNIRAIPDNEDVGVFVGDIKGVFFERSALPAELQMTRLGSSLEFRGG